MELPSDEIKKITASDQTAKSNNPITKDRDVEKVVYSAEELLNMEVEELPMLIDPILQKTGVVAVAGSSDTGKSALLRQLAVSIVTKQKTFLGWEIKATHNKVIYVSTEDDKMAMAYLLRKGRTEDLSISNYSGLKMIFDHHKLLENLEKELKKDRVDCIIIDAFADLYSDDINVANQVRTYIQNYNRLAEKYGCLIIFLHHTKKRSDGDAPSKDNLLGSQGFESKMRLVIELRNDLEYDELKHLCIVKGNYLPSKKFKDQSFVLRFNENLTFESTGERAYFSDLIRDLDKEKEERQKVKAIAIKLYKDGKSCEQISKDLSDEGYKNCGKSTVGKWVKGINRD